MPEKSPDSALPTMDDLHRLTQEEFTKTVLPNLFHSVDRASLNAQKAHLNYFRWSLVLLVLAASPALIKSIGVFLVSPERQELLLDISKFTALLSALFFAGTLIINFVIRLRQQDRAWYQTRALAESAKTMAWKYMMGAEPYSLKLGIEQADQRLFSDLRGILSVSPKIGYAFDNQRQPQQQITDGMRAIRGADLANRCQTYLRFRLEDETNWYARKSAQHASAEQRLFNWVVICQLAALFLAMTRIAWPKTPFDAGSILAALATALLAWSQLKRYGEQATAYVMAAQELAFISEQAKYIQTDSELAGYVADSENAVSREHTMWLARREVTNVQVAARVS